MQILSFFIIIQLLQTPQLIVISPDFPNDGSIPSKYTCEGDNINPTLIIHGLPEGTKSMALIVESTDTAASLPASWVVWNIRPGDRIPEASVPGKEDFRATGKRYHGPCPAKGASRFVFRVYALDAMLDLKVNAGKKELMRHLDGHILARGELFGYYDHTVAAVKEKEER